MTLAMHLIGRVARVGTFSGVCARRYRESPAGSPYVSTRPSFFWGRHRTRSRRPFDEAWSSRGS